MVKQFFLIFSGMVMVFSLMLIGGGFTFVFIISPGAGGDKYVQTAISLTILVGLAGLFSGLVGLIGSVLLKAAEVQDAHQQAMIAAPVLEEVSEHDSNKTTILS